MNKLVTVFSALAVAAGIAYGEVKSANVVGYLYKSLTGEENNDVASVFGVVGGNNANLKLGDVEGAGDFSISNGDSLTIYSGGAAVVEAVYFPKEILEALEVEAEEGWWDVTVGDELDFSDTSLCYNNYALTAGQGFTVYASSDESGLVFPSPISVQ